MKHKLLILIPAFMTGLLLQNPVMAADAVEYEALLKTTQSALADTAQKVQLWSTTEILLDDAASAAASNDYDLAVVLVKEAGLQLELALATAVREKKTWQNGVPK